MTEAERIATLSEAVERRDSLRAIASVYRLFHGPGEGYPGIRIDRFGDLAFAELSEGQKQFVCILAVLVMEPRLLVLDEPMTSLDAFSMRRLRRKLLALPQKIVMISHDLDHFRGFDRILWLEEGRLRMDGRPEEVLAAYQGDIDVRLAEDMEAAAI